MSTLGLPGAWGIVGVVALLGNAIYRLLPLALELAEYALSTVQLVALVGWSVVSAYAEGYRGFHRQFSPRVVARARHLGGDRRWYFVVIAPLYCIGLVHATRKRLIVSWTLTIAIIGLVLAVRQLAQPWRGIIDVGVVIGLAMGIVSIAYFVMRTARGAELPVPPDVPA